MQRIIAIAFLGCLSILVVAQSQSFSGRLLGISDGQLVSIDPATGVANSMSTDLPAGLFNVTEAALDNAGRRYFLSNVLSTENPTNHLLVIDLDSGAVSSFDLIINGIEFDSSTGRLIGISDGQLVSIDPATGVANSISTDLPAGLFNVTEAALDNAGRRYFLSNVLSTETPTNHLLVIDLDSGAVSSFDLIINGIEFDSSTGRLIGISDGQLVSIDPATGVASSISTDLPVGLSNVTEAGLDNTGRRYFLSNVLSTETPTNHLLVIDLNSGSVSSFDLIINGVVFDRATSITVSIDIKPNSFPNSINRGSNGNVPVAIISSSTFDATTVDPSTVTLAGASVRLRGNGTVMSSHQDVNGDGLIDLVIHVSTEALQLSAVDTQAVLEGRTADGMRIRGTDSVRIVQ